MIELKGHVQIAEERLLAPIGDSGTRIRAGAYRRRLNPEVSSRVCDSRGTYLASHHPFVAVIRGVVERLQERLTVNPLAEHANDEGYGDEP